MTAQDLHSVVRTTKARKEIVEGLIREHSITLLIGTNTIGKTPFVLQMLLCIAAGIPFLGRPSRRSSVFCLVGEGDPAQFQEMLQAVCQHLGLDAVPSNFLFWSPYWGESSDLLTPGNAALARAREVGADVTAADPLRGFWPEAETKNESAAKTYAALRKIKTSWIIPHHLRKSDRKVKLPPLADEPHAWLEEASGSRALVTGADLRLGIEARTEQQIGDLCLCGLMRGQGQIGPFYLERKHDNATGEPMGYDLIGGIQLLAEKDRGRLQMLPTQDTFSFSDVKRVLGGKSDSNADRFIKRCTELELMYRVGEHYMRTPLQNPME